jgi:hypothetical protein
MMLPIVLLAISIVCWWLVLNKRAWKQQSEPSRHFFKHFFGSSKDQQNMLEALGYATTLIGAIFSTVFLVFLLVRWILS